MLGYKVEARRVETHEAIAAAKTAPIHLDTHAGRADAFNPAELMLAFVAACMIKGIERVAPILHFEFNGACVEIHGVRLGQLSPGLFPPTTC